MGKGGCQRCKLSAWSFADPDEVAIQYADLRYSYYYIMRPHTRIITVYTLLTQLYPCLTPQSAVATVGF